METIFVVIGDKKDKLPGIYQSMQSEGGLQLFATCLNWWHMDT